MNNNIEIQRNIQTAILGSLEEVLHQRKTNKQKVKGLKLWNKEIGDAEKMKHLTYNLPAVINRRKL